MNILIVGGSGGIGLALVQACLTDYPEAHVHATFHTHLPPLQHTQLTWHALNVTDEVAIAELAQALGHINLLINAVGFLHSPSKLPEKALKEFDITFFDQNIRLNTLPSILLAKYFSASLQRKTPTHFVVLSAKIGSLSDNKLGGWLSYRVSKAALNMALKTIAIEWARRAPNCCVLAFHPGTTDTDLSKPFQHNLPKGQLHSAGHTAAALLRLVKRATPDTSGAFMSYDGSEIPW